MWPYIRCKFFSSSAIQKKLHLDQPISLNAYEEEIALGAVHPDQIEVAFADIGGHDDVIQRLRENVQVMLMDDRCCASKLLRAPMGVLLYGPPGCGKTLLAKAMATSLGVRFLSVSLSTLLDKWVGESEKYIAAVFSLAHKIQPVILFIDEIDSITGRRGRGVDGEWEQMSKGQLLTGWDGIGRTAAEKIIVLGATNRRDDIDEAFLRRMPLQLYVGLPNTSQRKHILKILLGDVDQVIDNPTFEWDQIAEMTLGLSGSDLAEVCRKSSFVSKSFKTNHLAECTKFHTNYFTI